MTSGLAKFAMGFAVGLGVGIAVGVKVGEKWGELLASKSSVPAPADSQPTVSESAESRIREEVASQAKQVFIDESQFRPAHFEPMHFQHTPVPEAAGASLTGSAQAAEINKHGEEVLSSLHDQEAPPDAETEKAQKFFAAEPEVTLAEAPPMVEIPLSEESVKLESVLEETSASQFHSRIKVQETEAPTLSTSTTSNMHLERGYTSSPPRDLQPAVVHAEARTLDYQELRARIEETRRRIQRELEQSIRGNGGG